MLFVFYEIKELLKQKQSNGTSSRSSSGSCSRRNGRFSLPGSSLIFSSYCFK